MNRTFLKDLILTFLHLFIVDLEFCFKDLKYWVILNFYFRIDHFQTRIQKAINLEFFFPQQLTRKDYLIFMIANSNKIIAN